MKEQFQVEALVILSCIFLCLRDIARAALWVARVCASAFMGTKAAPGRQNAAGWLILLCMTLACSAEAHTSKAAAACDRFLQTSPSRTYVRLIRHAYDGGILNDEDLHHIVTSPEPVNPLAEAAAYNQIAIASALTRILPLLDPLEWEAVRNDLNKAIQANDVNRRARESAYEQTTHAFSFIAESTVTEEVRGSGRSFVSSKGEIFDVTRSRHAISIQEKFSRSSVQIKSEEFGRRDDFFETRSGQVLYAVVSLRQLSVYDARTGEMRVEVLLTSMRNIESAISRSPLDPIFYPLLYETEDGPKVAIVPRNFVKSMVDYRGQIPIALVDIRTGKLDSEGLPSGLLGFKRLTDGHIYAFGGGDRQNLAGLGRFVFARDLTIGKTVLNEPYDPKKAEVFEDAMAGWEAFLDAKGGFHLAAVSRAGPENMAVFSMQNKRFVEVLNFPKVMSHSGFKFYHDPAGNPTAAVIHPFFSNTIRRRQYNLVWGPVLEDRKPSEVRLAGVATDNVIIEVEVITRPEGRLFLAWEGDFGGRRVAVHIYDETAKDLIRIPIPRDETGRELLPTFYSPRDKRIFSDSLDATMRTKIYRHQIYGPLLPSQH